MVLFQTRLRARASHARRAQGRRPAPLHSAGHVGHRMMPRPRLADEDARRRASTELDRNFIVEAGAGTGKTRILVDRIENLVAAGTVPLRNVVAITFTEKAAAE